MPSAQWAVGERCGGRAAKFADTGLVVSGAKTLDIHLRLLKCRQGKKKDDVILPSALDVCVADGDTPDWFARALWRAAIDHARSNMNWKGDRGKGVPGHQRHSSTSLRCPLDCIACHSIFQTPRPTYLY